MASAAGIVELRGCGTVPDRVKVKSDSGRGAIETVPVHARDLPADERDPIWETQKQRYPGFADYESKTSRTIPVVLLTRRAD